jgi:hypothetical protein
MTIFDVNVRRDTERKRLTESVFAYLSRSAKCGSEMSRDLIEEWLARVAQSEQASRVLKKSLQFHSVIG